MESRKLNGILILLLFVFFGCNQQTRTHIERINVESTNSEEPQTKDTSVNLDSIFHFHCGADTTGINFGMINRAYFPTGLRRCLLEEGFKGNHSANRQIATIIKIINPQHFSVFGRNPKFRGPEIFEVLLPLGDNSEPSKDYDGNLSGRTIGMVQSGYYLEMIESIDGTDISEFFNTMMRKRYSKEELAAIATEEPYMKKFSAEHYKVIRKAWEQGKIKLKPFGVD